MQGCPGTLPGKSSSFTITGRGGLPDDPYETLNAEPSVWIDWRSLEQSTQNRQSKPVNYQNMLPESKTSYSVDSEPTSIVEANSWQFDPKGEVILTATNPSAPSLPSLQCHTLHHIED